MKQGEIKFRVWDKILKFMRIPTQLTFHGNGEYSGFWVEGSAFSNKENYELMQYTGLKDKNGKEIYEGDIILGSARTLAGYVKFMDAGFIVVRPNDGIDDMRGRLGKSYEVIGNIYQNPDLLKGDK
mgnify:CR=1 FL=1